MIILMEAIVECHQHCHWPRYRIGGVGCAELKLVKSLFKSTFHHRSCFERHSLELIDILVLCSFQRHSSNENEAYNLLLPRSPFSYRHHDDYGDLFIKNVNNDDEDLDNHMKKYDCKIPALSGIQIIPPPTKT